jgi:hypothetical protein
LLIESKYFADDRVIPEGRDQDQIEALLVALSEDFSTVEEIAPRDYETYQDTAYGVVCDCLTAMDPSDRIFDRTPLDLYSVPAWRKWFPPHIPRIRRLEATERYRKTVQRVHKALAADSTGK